MREICAALILVATGCLVGENAGDAPGFTDPGGDPSDPGGGGDDDPGSINRPIPSNGLVLDAALARQLPTGALGTRSAGGVVTLAPAVAAKFGTEAGKHLMKYVAICALPQADAIVVDGTRLDGYYNLAPAWATGSCGESCQRWMSACLLSHANANGTPVPLGLHADRPADFAPAAELAQFTFQEAAYYGNLWRGELHACVGTGMLDQGIDLQRFFNGRVCGLGGCDIVNSGPCKGLLGNSQGACDRIGVALGDCHVGSAIESTPRTSAVMAEVITVYLKP
ncbi:MAG: hypothetical protein KIT31_43470 [Deltaproteobacteria bacterium]|nr:hypothetical protein [Deltaproteobacteria bacterium]